MSDSPFIHAPLDPREKPILESLLVIRDKFLLLKQDRSTYVKSQDVIPLYEQVIEQVQLLNEIRAENKLEQNRGSRLADDEGILFTKPTQSIAFSTIAFSLFRCSS